LLALHRGGHIELPAAKPTMRGNAWARRQPAPVAVDMTPIECSLGELGAVALRQARRTDEASLVNSLVAHHHYLGYRQPVGEQLKYLVVAGERPIVSTGFSATSRPRCPHRPNGKSSAITSTRSRRFTTSCVVAPESSRAFTAETIW